MWLLFVFFFFFNDTATTEIYTLSLHDALPICWTPPATRWSTASSGTTTRSRTARSSSCAPGRPPCSWTRVRSPTYSARSEEHTSELQSRQYLVCRLLLEKKKKKMIQK